jgi:hypothetical protein
MAKAAAPRLRQGAALLTLTYLGAERAVPNYNTMGLAKASLEASVRYLAASLGPRGWGQERRHPGGRQRQGQAQDQPQATGTAPGGEPGPLGDIL